MWKNAMGRISTPGGSACFLVRASRPRKGSPQVPDPAVISSLLRGREALPDFLQRRLAAAAMQDVAVVHAALVVVPGLSLLLEDLVEAVVPQADFGRVAGLAGVADDAHHVSRREGLLQVSGATGAGGRVGVRVVVAAGSGVVDDFSLAVCDTMVC